MIRISQSKGADSGRDFEFDQDLIRIGRMPDSDVNLDPEVDLDASGRHAEIRSEDGRYLLIDTGSRNGTWLNGQRIKHAALSLGDEIELGRGGPKLKIASMQARPGGRGSAGRTPSAISRRDPRFDPFAAPDTPATLGHDPSSRPDLLTGSLRFSGSHRGTTTSRQRGRSSVILWGAAGVVFLAAIAIIVGASFQ